MKTLKYKYPLTGSMTYFTTKYDIEYDVDNNPIGITHHSYTFTSGELVVIEDIDDANELLLNGVFEEVEPIEE